VSIPIHVPDHSRFSGEFAGMNDSARISQAEAGLELSGRRNAFVEMLLCEGPEDAIGNRI
jgi:hypothetical protein